MPINPSFPCWLGTLLGHSEHEVQLLLEDKSALYFLIAWSIFESKCFDGFVRVSEIKNFTEETYSTIDSETLKPIAQHFHARYQCPQHFRNLMHTQKDPKISETLKSSFDNISNKDHLYFIVFIIYRYRNNIFHGNKGAQSWLQYKEQIQHCIRAMQIMISHAESNKPTMNK